MSTLLDLKQAVDKILDEEGKVTLSIPRADVEITVNEEGEYVLSQTGIQTVHLGKSLPVVLASFLSSLDLLHNHRR